MQRRHRLLNWLLGLASVGAVAALAGQVGGTPGEAPQGGLPGAPSQAGPDAAVTTRPRRGAEEVAPPGTPLPQDYQYRGDGGAYMPDYDDEAYGEHEASEHGEEDEEYWEDEEEGPPLARQPGEPAGEPPGPSTAGGARGFRPLSRPS